MADASSSAASSTASMAWTVDTTGWHSRDIEHLHAFDTIGALDKFDPPSAHELRMNKTDAKPRRESRQRRNATALRHARELFEAAAVPLPDDDPMEITAESSAEPAAVQQSQGESFANRLHF